MQANRREKVKERIFLTWGAIVNLDLRMEKAYANKLAFNRVNIYQLILSLVSLERCHRFPLAHVVQSHGPIGLPWLELACGNWQLTGPPHNPIIAFQRG